MRFVTDREARLLRSDAPLASTIHRLEHWWGPTGPHTLRVRPWEFHAHKSVSLEAARLRNAAGVTIVPRRPRCRACTRLIDDGERVVRFYPNREGAYPDHPAFIHAEPCRAVVWNAERQQFEEAIR